MTELSWILAALFLPLFPLGMLFNTLFQKSKNVWLRLVIILCWPLPGIWILQSDFLIIPSWLVYWSLFSALLYGFRSVVIKDFSIWTGFLATSAWSLCWLAPFIGYQPIELWFHVLAFCFPLLILVLLIDELEKRYQSAYVTVIGGLAHAQPKLAALFVFTLLAAIGSPLFPSFFFMVGSITRALSSSPVVAFTLVAIWFLWSWSGISLLQQLLVGSKSQVAHRDIGQVGMAGISVSLVVLVAGGLYISRIAL